MYVVLIPQKKQPCCQWLPVRGGRERQQGVLTLRIVKLIPRESWQSASLDRLHRRSLHGSVAILLSILRSAEKVATICEEPQLMPDVHVRVALPTRLLEKTKKALFGERITTILHRTSCLMLFYRVSKLPHSRAKCVRDQVHQELSDGT